MLVTKVDQVTLSANSSLCISLWMLPRLMLSALERKICRPNATLADIIPMPRTESAAPPVAGAICLP